MQPKKHIALPLQVSALFSLVSHLTFEPDPNFSLQNQTESIKSLFQNLERLSVNLDNLTEIETLESNITINATPTLELLLEEFCGVENLTFFTADYTK